jgi:ribosomal protein L3
METTTRIYRDFRKNWRAATSIDLEDARVLRIETSKNDSGYVTTLATVHKRERDTLIHAMFADYSKYLAKEKIRATDKAITAQHDKVLADLPTIMADVTRHYAGEPALLA